ncbi:MULTISPECIES: hypothetical protein [Serratia]|uniref:hypothetical protein n=1 Tax=Serratia TaxID=613 RepID=UPI0023614B25|nr:MULTISPECIES: hypothetical protein [Serratia]
MNTRNVNVKTAAQEPSERYAMKENAFRDSRSPDFPEVRHTAYTNSEQLTVPQVYDLFRYVCDAAGRSTGTLLPPDLPEDAEYLYVAFDGHADSVAVWLVDGWPLAASDEMSLVHWSLLRTK